jgi:hypothetical protein
MLNLDSTVYLDFFLPTVVDKDDEAVLRHRRAIKVRLAGSEICTNSSIPRITLSRSGSLMAARTAYSNFGITA